MPKIWSRAGHIITTRRVLLFVPIVCAIWRILKSRMKKDTMKLYLNSSDSRMQRIVAKCPSFNIPYQAPWWCFHSIVNTVVMLMKQQMHTARCPDLVRDTINRPDGSEVSIDWYPAGGLEDDAPILCILHTITGNSRQQAGFMKYAYSRGWRCCVLNRRGHSDMPLRVPSFSILGNIDDTKAMVDRIKDKHPNSFIALAGISAGSGQVVSYIGREQDKVPVHAAASLCPAWDLTKSFDHLKEQFPMMDRYIMQACKDFFLERQENQTALAILPDAVSQAKKATTMKDFMVASVPFAGCETLEEYFAQNNPTHFMLGNRIPCLALNALDDFLCVKENIRLDLIDETSSYVLIVTDEGSHIAYNESSPECGNYMWRITMDFFEAVREDDKVSSE